MAAEVQPEAIGNRAYVFVKPVIDPLVGSYEKQSDFSESKVVRTHVGKLIDAYRLQYRELRSGFEDFPDDWDKYRYSSYEREYPTLVELEEQLQLKWQLKLEEMKLPNDVDHPF